MRATAFGALERLHQLGDDILDRRLRRRIGRRPPSTAEIAAAPHAVSLLALLADADSFVVEMAAWACGEHEQVDDATLARLIELGRPTRSRCAGSGGGGARRDRRRAGSAGDPPRQADKPAVRRRAVIALAPFDGPEVDAALQRALSGLDWQVRQAAEVLVSDD